MQPGPPRLGISYGTACARAVLAWPDGRWQPLSIDGVAEWSMATHTGSSAEMVLGAPAWQRAQSTPDGFVVSPLQVVLSTPATGGDHDGDTPVVAALRLVSGAAAELAGGPVEDVRLVMPAEWGPRRQTWLRRVARHAGLGQPTLVPAPVAAAERLLTLGVQVPVGAYLLIVDLGSGCEASVLRRRPTGFEVLSTQADPGAGGARVDDLMTAALTGSHPPADTVRWPVGRGA
jgi:hypothetical protein